MSKGWECPRCGAVNAPWKDQCGCASLPAPLPTGVEVPDKWDWRQIPNEPYTITYAYNGGVRELGDE